MAYYKHWTTWLINFLAFSFAVVVNDLYNHASERLFKYVDNDEIEIVILVGVMCCILLLSALVYAIQRTLPPQIQLELQTLVDGRRM
jgi:hypothetical protein